MEEIGWQNQLIDEGVTAMATVDGPTAPHENHSGANDGRRDMVHFKLCSEPVKIDKDK